MVEHTQLHAKLLSFRCSKLFQESGDISAHLGCKLHLDSDCVDIFVYGTTVVGFFGPNHGAQWAQDIHTLCSPYLMS
jgi:hypothetical protein